MRIERAGGPQNPELNVQYQSGQLQGRLGKMSCICTIFDGVCGIASIDPGLPSMHTELLRVWWLAGWLS